ncbi:MAG: peptidylprolyl isomerase, partial [Dehalococcoidia bacterium]
GASKAELDAITSAKLYEQRLIEKFKGDLPKTLSQVQLVMARIQDQATADRVRSIALRPGVDFGPVAAQNSVSDRSAANAGVPTWVIVDELDAPTRAAVRGMKVGDVSAVIPNGTYYDVYKVTEVSASRELDDDQKTQLATKKLEAWLAEEAKQVKVERDLTTQKEQWITDHVVNAYQKASATPRAN